MNTQRRQRTKARGWLFVWLTLAALGTWHARASAAESASGVLLYQQVNATTVRYNIDLNNTGTTPIGTLWYSWTPGEDFMGSQPTNVIAPAGWSATVTNSGAGDGFAIEFVNSSGPLMPGDVLKGFQFDSSQTLAQLAGNSPFFPASHVGTTFIYSGGPFSDPGYQFEIDPTNLPWQNPFSRFDVDDNGVISAHDAVLIINALITGHVRTLATPTTSDAPPFLDVRGDNLLSAADAVAVINHLITTKSGTAQTAALEMSQAGAVVFTATPRTVSLAEPGGFTNHSVPEPASFALLAMGLAALAVLLPTIRRTRAIQSRSPFHAAFRFRLSPVPCALSPIASSAAGRLSDARAAAAAD